MELLTRKAFSDYSENEELECYEERDKIFSKLDRENKKMIYKIQRVNNNIQPSRYYLGDIDTLQETIECLDLKNGTDYGIKKDTVTIIVHGQTSEYEISILYLDLEHSELLEILLNHLDEPYQQQELALEYSRQYSRRNYQNEENYKAEEKRFIQSLRLIKYEYIEGSYVPFIKAQIEQDSDAYDETEKNILYSNILELAQKMESWCARQKEETTDEYIDLTKELEYYDKITCQLLYTNLFYTLVDELDELMYEMDYYDYIDNHSSREEAKSSIEEALKSADNIEVIKTYLEQLNINEEAHSKIQVINLYLDKLKEYFNLENNCQYSLGMEI